MEFSGFALHDSNYSQKIFKKCSLPPTVDLQKHAKGVGTIGMNATLTKASEGREKSIRATRRSSFDLDEQFENHDEFIEIISSFMEQRDSHTFNPDAHSVRFRATLARCLSSRMMSQVALKTMTKICTNEL
ncbi:hypothetical protein V1515DRAFT_589402 [Lipomyces mesembrius]